MERQNEDGSIQRLAAQRRLYSDAKWARRLRVAGTLGLALSAPIVVFLWRGVGDWLGALASAWILLSRLVLRPLERARTLEAANVQEEFDVYVFGLPWNDAKGSRPRVQDVARAARRFLSNNADVRRAGLTDWYADPRTAVYPYDVLICQQANLSWSARLHHEWSALLLSIAAIWTGFGIVIGVVSDLSLGQYLVALLLPSLPALIDSVDAAEASRTHAAQHDLADEAARLLWSSGVSGLATVTTADCRSLQDQIWDLRRNPILVPDWYYRRRRTGQGLDMQAAAAALVAEAQASGLA